MPILESHSVHFKGDDPLVRVLRLVDNDKKPIIGYIYEAMDRTDKTIMKSFDRIEEKHENF